MNPHPKEPRDGCKPCACGKPDCFVRQRDNEKPYYFLRRRFASRACWKSENAQLGALISSLDWLAKPPGRIIAQRQAQGIAP